MNCRTFVALTVFYRLALCSNDKLHATTFRNFGTTKTQSTPRNIPEFKNDPMFVVPPSGTFSPLDQELIPSQYKSTKDESSSTMSPKVRAIMRHLPIGFYGYPNYYNGEFEQPQQLGPFIHREVPKGTSSEEFWKDRLIGQLKDLKRVLMEDPNDSVKSFSTNQEIAPYPQLDPVPFEKKLKLNGRSPETTTQKVLVPNEPISNEGNLKNISELNLENETNHDVNVSSNVSVDDWNTDGSQKQGFRSFQEAIAKSVGDYYPNDAHDIHIALETPNKRLHEFHQSDFQETSTEFMKLEDMVDDFGNITPKSIELDNPSKKDNYK